MKKGGKEDAKDVDNDKTEDGGDGKVNQGSNKEKESQENSPDERMKHGSAHFWNRIILVSFNLNMKEYLFCTFQTPNDVISFGLLVVSNGISFMWFCCTQRRLNRRLHEIQESIDGVEDEIGRIKEDLTAHKFRSYFELLKTCHKM